MKKLTIEDVLTVTTRILDNLAAVLKCYNQGKKPETCQMQCYYRRFCDYVFQEMEIELRETE